MALWNVDIQKKLGDERWTNRYILRADTITMADGVAQLIYNYERSVHSPAVEFERIRTSDRIPDTDVYIINELHTFGLFNYDGERTPLWNVAVVLFETLMGRPSRKYLRIPIHESQMSGDNLGSGLIAALDQNYAQPMWQLPEFVDVDDQRFVGASVQPTVGMRQLRRGSKRKLQTII